MLACAIEPGAPTRVVVGCQGGALSVFDIATSRRASQVCCADCSCRECLLHLCSPCGSHTVRGKACRQLSKECRSSCGRLLHAASWQQAWRMAGLPC
jgi:hypothetical protein